MGGTRSWPGESMSVTLNCPRCKSENQSGQSYCQRCGFGLDRTGSVSEEHRVQTDEWIGKTINNKYRISSILGEGGFGTVFRAEMLLFEDHKPFALKLLHPDLSRNEHFRKRFLREAAMAMELVHPNAIQVRDFDQTEEGLLYFTMDYCPGEPLKAVLSREGFFTINRAIPLVAQILSVLEAAHAKEIIHRDLKPENVFLVRDQVPMEIAVVGDFGLAKSMDRGTNRDSDSKDLTQGGIVGTPRYMSPEQGRGEPLDGRSDLYSVGVLLFEMIAGQLPPRLDGKGRFPKLSNGDPDSPGLQRLREIIPPNLVVPRALLEVILRALEPRPAARFQSAHEFREALEALPTYTPTYIEPRPVKKRRSFAVTVMVLLFLAGAGSLLFPQVRESLKEVASALSPEHFGPSPKGSNGDSTLQDGGSADNSKKVGSQIAKHGDESPRASGEPAGAGRLDDPQEAAGAHKALAGADSEGQLQNGPGTTSGDGEARPGGTNDANSGDQSDGHSATPVPTGGESTKGQPQPAVASTLPEGTLQEWTGYKVGDEIAFVTLRFRPDGTNDRKRTLYRAERSDPDKGILFENQEDELSDSEWWWLVSENEFSRTRVIRDGDGETTLMKQVELRWDGKRPLPSWEVDQAGVRIDYRVEVAAPIRVGNKMFSDLIVVVASRVVEGERTEKHTYFARNYGEVMLRTIVVDGDKRRVLFERHQEIQLAN